jgi:hypothetical protein
MPERRDGELKRAKAPKISDPEKIKVEEEIEKEIIEEGELMELAKPDDEDEEKEE